MVWQRRSRKWRNRWRGIRVQFPLEIVGPPAGGPIVLCAAGSSFRATADSSLPASLAPLALWQRVLSGELASDFAELASQGGLAYGNAGLPRFFDAHES